MCVNKNRDFAYIRCFGLLVLFGGTFGSLEFFQAFRDEVSLDLSATKITEHEEHVVEIANDRLLKVAAIYGANASGKSNVYAAFEYMTYYVENSFKFGGEDENRRKTEEDYVMMPPFLFDEKSRMEETTFEVFYVDNAEESGKIYQYGFSLKGSEVVEEWLYSKAKTARNRYRTIFYRKKGEELEMNGFAKPHVENIKSALNKESLIVSLGAIQDFDVEESAQKEEKEKYKNYEIASFHKMADSDEMASIPLEEESSGTLKMFALYPSLKEVLDSGAVLFIDELNARLHPLLVRNIILTFLSDEINTKNAQLIFTTHDVWQFTNELLRRDEIWLVDKGRDGASELYSLVEFKDEEGNKVRRDEALAKKYLTGSYGAIPALKPMEMLAGRTPYTC